MSVELKVYGHIYPATPDLEKDLIVATQSAIQDAISLDVPMVDRENDLVRISFEGRYFPVDDVLEIISAQISIDQKGKLDVLDIENWQMTRYLFNDGQITSKKASLNHVLDYSGF